MITVLPSRSLAQFWSDKGLVHSGFNQINSFIVQSTKPGPILAPRTRAETILFRKHLETRALLFLSCELYFSPWNNKGGLTEGSV